MKDNNSVLKIIQFLVIIPLYYIVGDKGIFLYAITLSLCNIYLSCFKHINLIECFKQTQSNTQKQKLLKAITIVFLLLELLFVILSIVISDTTNILLKIDNTFLPYLLMSLSVITEPLIKVFMEYLESYRKPKLATRLTNTYYILEIIFLLIISLLTFRIFKLPTYISISLLYLSKILSFVSICTIAYLILTKEIITKKEESEITIDYKKQIKYILTNNSHKSIISLVKNSYYYISMVILYVILTSIYSYEIILIEKELTFLYLYALTIVKFIIDITLKTIKQVNPKITIINYICKVFESMMTIAIIIGITSPLICQVIFNNNESSLYLMMMILLSIFIALYDLTFENIKNKKIIYISLVIGIVSKIILIVPLINAFYRMGYNLIYGDIISTIMGMLISIIINYVYIKNQNKKEKTLEKIFKTLYESILLCIALVIMQFIIPIKTTNYIVALIYLIIYIVISIIFLEYKKKKRG